MPTPAKLITDGALLQGSAMPDLLKKFRGAVIGRTIVSAGYYHDGYGRPLPCLLLDNGDTIVAQSDDEGNDAGVLATNAHILPRTEVR